VVGNAFNERNSTRRRDSVMVLDTPARPMLVPGRAWARSDAAASLVKLWTDVVDPRSNAAVTAEALGKMRLFTRMTRSDASTTFPDVRSASEQMIGELIAPRSY